ncbi:MAG: DEAD/DEAH box helicase family protein, partial [Phycisphaerae bacterium]
EIGDAGPRRRPKGRTDYVLRIKITLDSQPVAVGLIEAKTEHLPPAHGLEQAKLYAACRRLNVPFVFSSNGHLFVEFDRFTGKTTAPQPLSVFPSPADLRQRYEAGMGLKLDAEAARPLLVRYPGGEATRRYYQDAAIRAVLEAVARGQRRALLSLATGAGKTFIAVNLLRRIADAGQLRRALFVCDRDELRAQGLAAFQNAFGADAAAVSSGNPQKNARVLVATYQTLGVASDDGDASFLLTHYPPDYFSHIVIDECHRSAWGKWSEVLVRNPGAVQVGLTATPRRLPVSENTPESQDDARISADNIRWFGEPVYEYDMAQGIEDGYLAACEIRRFDLFHDQHQADERQTGVSREDLAGKRVTDADTGEVVPDEQTRDRYSAPSLDDRLLMPDRVAAMCSSLFDELLAAGGPEQKTIIFCARDRHADEVAAGLNNLYADWCQAHGRPLADPYAFKCTAASSGNEHLADLRAASRRHFVATTVDLLSTGVDVPCVRNIVFFKYVRSPIAFYQMVGRGTRLHPPDGKLAFRVYDYTDATRLFGEDFITRHAPPRDQGPGPGPPEPPERTLRVEGFEVRVGQAGRYIVTEVDGKALPVTVEEYKARLAERLVAEVPTLERFRAVWVRPPDRRALLQELPAAGRSVLLVRELEEMGAYDLYDVLAELGYGLAPKTRVERAGAFSYKQVGWLDTMPGQAAGVIRAIADQFALAGTEGLENPAVFQTPAVATAGGVAALKAVGKPSEVLMETKTRMLAA